MRRRMLNQSAMMALNVGRANRGLKPLTRPVRAGSNAARSGGTV